VSCFIQLSSHTANASTHCLYTLLSNLWASKRLSSSVPVFNFSQPFSAIEINPDEDAKKEYVTIVERICKNCS